MHSLKETRFINTSFVSLCGFRGGVSGISWFEGFVGDGVVATIGVGAVSLVYDGMMWRNLEKGQGYIVTSRVKFPFL